MIMEKRGERNVWERTDSFDSGEVAMAAMGLKKMNDKVGGTV